MKIKVALCLSALVLSACASSDPEHFRGPGSERARVLVEHHYVPVRQAQSELWGEYKFVPGYARQGVIVTPSRTWTYGQGPGFASAQGHSVSDMASESQRQARIPRLKQAAPKMAAASGDNCLKSLPARSRQDFIKLGRSLSYMPLSESMLKPLSPVEQRRLAEYEKCFGHAQAKANVLAERRKAIQMAWQVEAGEKGGNYLQAQKDDFSDYQMPPPDMEKANQSAAGEQPAAKPDPAQEASADKQDEAASKAEPAQDSETAPDPEDEPETSDKASAYTQALEEDQGAENPENGDVDEGGEADPQAPAEKEESGVDESKVVPPPIPPVEMNGDN